MINLFIHTVTKTGNACQADDGDCGDFAIHRERVPPPSALASLQMVNLLSKLFPTGSMFCSHGSHKPGKRKNLN